MLVLVERLVRLLTEALEPVGVGEDLPRGGQLLVLVLERLHLVDLAQLERQEIDPCRPLAGVHLGRREGVAGRDPCRVRRADLGREPAVRPATRSSRSRCVSGSCSVWCSCCPCRSTHADTRSLIVPAVTSTSSMNARERPSDDTSRRTITSVPSGVAMMAWTEAAVAPVRTMSAEARPPRSRPMPSTSTDLPAPVSPVSTVRPPSSDRSSASITASCRMLMNRIMDGKTLPGAPD